MDEALIQTNAGLPEELQEQLISLAEHRDLAEIKKIIVELPPADAANAIELFEPAMQIAVFRSLGKNEAAEIFTYVEPELRLHLVESLSSPGVTEKVRQEFIELFNELPADDAADFLDELPANLVEALLSNVKSIDRRRQLNTILKYPPNSAGSIMTVEYIMLGEQMTASEALAYIRRQGRNKETIYNCYAVGQGRKLAGAVSLRDIILAHQDTKISEIMSAPVIYAKTLEDQENVATKFKEYDLLAMPVVDMEGRLVGIITIDDVVDVIEAENTEDFEKMAALSPSEGEYLTTGVFQLARNRIIWLMVMMISATLTGCIISHFESLLAKEVILASFIPMLMDTGGNCGAQVATLIIRGMAVGEIELKDWILVVWKEIRVGMTVAAALCFINCIRMFIVHPHIKPGVAVVVNITLFITVTFAKIIGCLLPMGAKWIKKDPALMASPMITTIVDAFTLFIYFMVAQRLFAL